MPSFWGALRAQIRDSANAQLPAVRRPGCARVLGLLVAAAPAAAPAGTVTIDGRLDPGEWEGARYVDDFRKTQPFNGEPASLPTEAWILPTPEGLAVAFRNTQPPNVPRTYQRTRRDENAVVDRINVMLDLNGDGRTGYDFTLTLTGGITDAIITNESRMNNDWDGLWEYAVGEDEEGWNAEVLIPWHTAPMRKAKDGKRTIGLYLDRIIGSTGERSAWPVASFQNSRFLSNFNRMDVPAYDRSLLSVTPYGLAIYDNLGGGVRMKKGIDLLWKPNGQTQLTATLRPDFGQVESDDLVVNFSAEETFFSDKRPFFTENQGLFDFGMLQESSQLIYTRRVGGKADDGGIGLIDGALKLTGSLGSTHYGIISAQEDGEAGRTFSALRMDHDFDRAALGMMATRVERPWLRREASVLGVDHRWRINDSLMVKGNVIGSAIEDDGYAYRDIGATLAVDYEVEDGWSQQWHVMHFGDDFDVNDFGYLPRNDFNYAHWEVRRRFVHMPADSSYSAREWKMRANATANDHGLSLRRQLRFTLKGNLRDGGSETVEVNVNGAGHDDLLTRRNAPMRTAFNASASWERSRPRKGNWAWKANVKLSGNDLSGNDRIGYKIQGEPTLFFSDALSVFGGLTYESSPERLIWQREGLIGSFDSEMLQLSAGMAWNIGSRQELRFRLQALGMNARLRQGYIIDDRMRAVAVADRIDDFGIRNLGLQVRYRYELAPLSDFYIVYGRGGYDQEHDPFSSSAGRQFVDSFRLRDSDQLMVKLSYRFEI